MANEKPLPQFNSLQESKEFFAKYGKLTYYGREGYNYEYCIYRYDVIDGRRLSLKLYDNGKVEKLR